MVIEGAWSAVLAPVLAGLREEAYAVLRPGQIAPAARAMGIHRLTLYRWLDGNDHVSVWTLCQIAAWLARQQGETEREETAAE